MGQKSVIGAGDVYGDVESVFGAGSGQTQADTVQSSKSPVAFWLAMIAILVGIRVLYEAAGENI